MEFIIFFICIPLVYSELHKFITTYTGIRGQTTAGIPEFSAVTTLDDQQIDYYDSNTMELIPRKDWMKFASEDMWTEDTVIRQSVQMTYKNNIYVVMQRFNQSHGVHTYQRMYGCEWDDETGNSQGFDLHGYDGEDFISLDLNQFRYFTSVPQAKPTVEKWNNDTAQLQFLKQYYDYECVYWLKYLLKLRKEDLERRAPEVSLLQKDLSSPVECHATGFYPSGVTITWLRNELEYHEHVDLGKTLPNEDGTFQKTSAITITPDDWKENQYTCVVEHMGKNIQKILTEDEIKSNSRPKKANLETMCVMGAFIVIFLVIGAVVCITHKKRMSRYKQVSTKEQTYINKRD